MHRRTDQKGLVRTLVEELNVDQIRGPFGTLEVVFQPEVPAQFDRVGYSHEPEFKTLVRVEDQMGAVDGGGNRNLERLRLFHGTLVP